MLLYMTLQRQVQQHRITKGSHISSFLSKHPGYYVTPTYNQRIDCTTFVYEFLNVQGNELRLFMGQYIPPTLTIYFRAPDIEQKEPLLTIAV